MNAVERCAGFFHSPAERPSLWVGRAVSTHPGAVFPERAGLAPASPLTHGKLGAGWGRCRALPENSQQGASRGLGDKVGRVLSVLSPWPVFTELIAQVLGASLVAQWVKNPPAMQGTQETWVGSLGWKDPLEKEMATHSCILAWEILWTEEPGGYSPKARK